MSKLERKIMNDELLKPGETSFEDKAKHHRKVNVSFSYKQAENAVKGIGKFFKSADKFFASK